MPKLPEEWKWARLGEIHILKSEKHTGSGESLFYVGLEHIKKDRGTLTEFVKIDVINTVKNSFKVGDLLYGKLRPYLNKVYLANEDGVCSTDILVFESNPSLNLNYSKYFFLSYKFVNDMTHNSSGVNLPRVSTKYLLEYPFPLCPLPEQRAIISKIELLFSELDNGIANLKLAQEQLKVYRQAVLKKAFEGELTRKWRERQRDLPDAWDLLEQIRVEREEAAKLSGKKQKLIKPLTEAELAGLPKMPEGWIWVRLDAIGELFCGQSPSITEVNLERRGILYVTGPEQWDGSKIKETKWTEFPKRLVPEGCIFITVKGAGVGKTFPGISCAIGRDIYAFLPSSKVDFKYTIHALIHQIDVVIMKAQGDIPGLSKDHILDHYIGLCSIEEQHAIVQEIEIRLSVCDKIEQDIEENLIKAEALRQSILKKAFEGKLLNERELAEVRRAEDWEPAEVLLEKIRAERVGKLFI